MSSVSADAETILCYDMSPLFPLVKTADGEETGGGLKWWHMKAELKKYYDSLVAERARLQEMIQAEEGERYELSVETDTGDEADKSVVATLREFTITRVDLGRQTLRLIAEAIERYHQGEYGYCLKCGEPISPKRLTALPWARYCVKCQELKEKGLLKEEDDEEPIKEI